MSRDESVFNASSRFRARAEKYGSFIEKLSIIVPTTSKYESVAFGNGIRAIPVYSRFKILAYFKSYKVLVRIAHTLGEGTIVSSQEELGGLICYYASRRIHLPWQAQIHSDIFNPLFISFSFQNRIRSFIARRILPRATRIRVVSERIKRSIEAMDIRVPVDVLPIYADIEVFHGVSQHEYARGENFVFLIVSRLAPEKDIDRAMTAFLRVAEKRPESSLCIIGDGPLRAHLGRIAKSFPQGDRIKFMGAEQDPHTIAKYMHSADCFISSSRYEGYGMSIVEAMAAGLPVVITDAGVAGELVHDGESGLVVPPCNTDALTQAMERIYSDTELRKAIGSAAHARTLGLYSQDAYLEQYKKNLSLCLNKN